jgi:hypothetical protein
MRFKALRGSGQRGRARGGLVGGLSLILLEYSMEVDEVSVAVYIVDGDTFDIAMRESVRARL